MFTLFAALSKPVMVVLAEARAPSMMFRSPVVTLIGAVYCMVPPLLKFVMLKPFGAVIGIEMVEFLVVVLSLLRTPGVPPHLARLAIRC